jgi:hypothetical protein
MPKPIRKFVALREGDAPIHPADEGALEMRCAFDPESRQVILDFGKPVKWLGLTADDAENMANILLKNAAIARGQTQ